MRWSGEIGLKGISRFGEKTSSDSDGWEKSLFLERGSDKFTAMELQSQSRDWFDSEWEVVSKSLMSLSLWDDLMVAYETCETLSSRSML